MRLGGLPLGRLLCMPLLHVAVEHLLQPDHGPAQVVFVVAQLRVRQDWARTHTHTRTQNWSATPAGVWAGAWMVKCGSLPLVPSGCILPA